MTEYVTTRWYRSPEVIVGWHRYSFAVDMWAAGTILAELITRKPLFQGSNSAQQLAIIADVLGRPSQTFIEKCRKPNYRRYLSELPIKPNSSLDLSVPEAGRSAMMMLKSLLQMVPTDRPTATDCLSMSWLRPMVEGIEIASPIYTAFPPQEFAFEAKELTVDDIRAEILIEMDLSAAVEEGEDGDEFADDASDIQKGLSDDPHYVPGVFDTHRRDLRDESKIQQQAVQIGLGKDITRSINSGSGFKSNGNVSKSSSMTDKKYSEHAHTNTRTESSSSKSICSIM
jgi:serine/threonine protein kinase